MHLLDRTIPKLPQVCLYFFCGVMTVLAVIAGVNYPGQLYIYLLFTLISNALLYVGFRKKALFFDAFIGVFFWLGFWLKVTLRVGFTNGVFRESTGVFDGSGAEFDRGLLVASCGLLALIAATLVRARFFCYQGTENNEITQPGLFNFYQKNRKLVLTVFVLLFLVVGISNVYFGIYQRGEVPQTILPYGLGGIYKWLLLFGLSSFAAVILKFEYHSGKNNSYLVAILSLLENFISNVSLLSRGMILNSAALFYGLLKDWKFNFISLRGRFLIIISLIFSLLFAGSVLTVNYLRSNAAALGLVRASSTEISTEIGEELIRHEEDLNRVKGMTTPLFIDRWVGIEGVLAVSSSKQVGWGLWHQAWREVYSNHSTSFYDLNLVESPYLTADTTKNHYISLPGIVAFLFYPGSFLFLFVGMFLIGAIGAAIEFAVYKFGGRNLILCSLLGQVVAFRFASFGYVPNQTYLLFGSLFLNLLIIYVADKLLSRGGRRSGIPV